MEDKIKRYLAKIEQDYQVKILLACETGSRAWGFPSPDSDYDIRIIYMHEKDWYLSLNDKKDSIELMFENRDFDISGWDLKKSLKLLWKSNAAIMERIQSPIIYAENRVFVDEIKILASKTYSKIASMHHYLSMAKNMYEDVQKNDQVKLKKLFYALRTSMACQWIIKKDEIVPIEFKNMLENLAVNSTTKSLIYELIDLKSEKSESYSHEQIPEINQLIESYIHQAQELALSLPSSKANMDDMNAFFIKMLNG